MQVLKELQRRNVIRVAIGYVVSSWLLLQVADLAIEHIGSPPWVMKTILLVLALGFPVVLFFSWAYEVTPDGLKREAEVDRSASITPVTGQKLDRAIIVVVLLAVAYVAVEKYVLPGRLKPDTPEVAAQDPPLGVENQAASTEPVASDTNKSIAVLPFVNMSDDAGNEYFSDGISEEILNLLVKIRGLKVIARTSSFAFKGKNEDIRVIGDALGAKTVLEGSVRKSGDRVRITAQLIDVSDGAHIWSETYDRTVTDIFAVQDDVAAAIIDALQIHVGTNPTRGRPTENTEAYAVFLEARAAMNLADDYHAVELSLKAIELDPQFAEAHELLAYGYWLQAGYTMDAKSSQKAMFDAASRALTINPGLYFARALQGAGQLSKGAYLREIQGLERVLIEEPSHAAAAAALAYDLLFAGYFEEGSTIAERYVALDPLSAKTQYRRSQALSATGRERESLESLKLAGQLGVETTNLDLALVQLFEKRDEHAVVEYEAALQAQDLPTGWVAPMLAAALNPTIGQAYLDRHIPQIVASMPENARTTITGFFFERWYLEFGYLDRYYELIFEQGVDSVVWSDVDDYIYLGMIDRNSGFTTHPRFLELAEAYGLLELWDKRGPPDFCKKMDGQWDCK